MSRQEGKPGEREGGRIYTQKVLTGVVRMSELSVVSKPILHRVRFIMRTTLYLFFACGVSAPCQSADKRL